MLFLTPEFLVDPLVRPDGAVVAGLALYLSEGDLFARGMSIHGDVVDGPVGVDKDALASHVVAMSFTGPGPDRTPPTVAWWGCGWSVERAYKAARLGDWEAFGKNLDFAYRGELEHVLAPDSKRDLLYAAARIAGCWGGRVSPAGMVLVCPPEKREDVINAVKQ